MALSASTVWEFQSGGSMNNGGGYVATGTDYSQTPTPALALTDCYHAAGSTTLTSDTGVFTNAMIGNILKVVSGTNFTVGWFQIISRTNDNNVVVDRSLGAVANVTKDGVVNVGGALAFGIAAQDTAFWAALIAGNTVWFSGGNTDPGTTYSIAGNVAAGTPGTTTAPIIVQGYRATRNDVCTGTYRPTIACSTYTFACGNYTKWRNMIWTGSPTTDMVKTSLCGVIINCKAMNTTTTTGQAAFVSNASGISLFIGCEGISPFGYGFHAYAQTHFISCYAHDSAVGIYEQTGPSFILNCVVESCFHATNGGIYMVAYGVHVNNTIRNCNIGINGLVSPVWCVNNIIADCVVGAKSDSNYLANFWDYNCFYANGTARTNVTAGPHDIATDPALTGTVGKGTDGASVATSLVFTSATAPFSGVTTADVLCLFAGTGTGIKIGAYSIASVDSTSQLTLVTDPTDASHNITSCTFGVVKGSDFTIGPLSSCLDTGIDAETFSGVTV